MSEADTAGQIRVFWRQGCSSCARVKEFLGQRGVDFESVDIGVDPEGMRTLAELGVRSVPVVVRGKAFTFAQSLDDVARFLAIHGAMAERIPPEELMARWREVLTAAKALFRRTPTSLWTYEPAPGRSLLSLAYHVVRIPHAFLATVEEGVRDWVPISMEPPPEGLDDARLEALADEVLDRLDHWWAGLKDKTCKWTVEKYDGAHTAHVFLERQTWHTAHHTRQVAATLADRGVDITGVIREGLYDGLPMPERVW